jgi:hypothetical protein
VTRARPKVDRIACPWLIRRFVDPGAVFPVSSRLSEVAWRSPSASDATPFDIDERVLEPSRRALQLRHDDRGVRAWHDAGARSSSPSLVRGGRHRASLDLAPQAAGFLLAASLGLSTDVSMTTSHSLTPACCSTTPSIAGAGTRPSETHNWPSNDGEA